MLPDINEIMALSRIQKYVKNSSKTSYVITISKREEEIDVKLAQCIDYSWSREHVARGGTQTACEFFARENITQCLSYMTTPEISTTVIP